MANLLRAGICGRITLSFTNNGINLANNVKISVDQIISGDFTFDSIFSSTDPALTFNATSKQFELPTLAVGTTVTAVIEITSNVESAQTIGLNVVSDETDPNPLNNVGAINTTITTSNLSPAEKRLNWIDSGAVLLVDLGMAFPDETRVGGSFIDNFDTTFTPLVGEDCIARDVVPSNYNSGNYLIVLEDANFPEYRQGRVVESSTTTLTENVSAFTANNYAAVTSGDEYAITMIMVNPDAAGSNTTHDNDNGYVWQVVNSVKMTYVRHNAKNIGAGNDTVRVTFGTGGTTNNTTADGSIYFKAQYINDYMHLTYAYTSTGGKLIVNGKVMTWFGFTGNATPPAGDFYINAFTNAGNLVDPLLSRTSLNTALDVATTTPVDILQGRRREAAGNINVTTAGVAKGGIPPVAVILGDFSDNQLIQINQGLLVT